jgi:hypothetical protein
MNLRALFTKQRVLAALTHLGFSALVALLAASLVFFLWFPGSYRALAGGRELFVLVTGVDLALGPLLTLVVFDVRKGRRHLVLDLACIAALQLGALAYGLHTVYVARPVALVFEVDRFHVMPANHVVQSELPAARPEFRRLPLTGPWVVATRKPAPGRESAEALFQALAGRDTGQRPSFWIPFDDSVRAQVVARGRPIAVLLQAYPAHHDEIEEHLRRHGLDETTAKFLPVIAKGDWVALVDAHGDPVDFLPLDGYMRG